MSVEELLSKLTTWGSVSSIAGLIVTLWVAWRINTIRKSYISQALVPSYTSTIANQLRNLRKACRERNHEPIHGILAACRNSLCDLQPHLDKQRTNHVNNVLNVIDDALKAAGKEGFFMSCWKAHGELDGLVVSLKNLQIENQWRPKR